MSKAYIGLIAGIAAIALGAAPNAYAECVVTSAPPETLSVNLPGNPTDFDYAEERELCVASGTPDKARGEGCGYQVDFPVRPPPFLWGFMFGEGTWRYDETNGLPGLQAGALATAIPGTPGCGTIPCIIFGEQVYDETCGHGWDRLLGPP